MKGQCAAIHVHVTPMFSYGAQHIVNGTLPYFDSVLLCTTKT